MTPVSQILQLKQTRDKTATEVLDDDEKEAVATVYAVDIGPDIVSR